MVSHNWCMLSDDELAQYDIAEVNLAIAVGIPGAEALHVPTCLETLNKWTDLVRRGTNNAILNREKYPEYHALSDAEYRILTAFSVFYRHIGLMIDLDCYDPSRHYDGGDAGINFIYAALQSNRAVTCCTAPVIFASIGRRLGYPIKLVKTREHIFCRWAGDNGETFNIEATSKGYYRTPDEWYHNWPKPIFKEALRCGVFLTNLTPRQEVALFLSFRGICMLWNLRPGEAVKSFQLAREADPTDYFYRDKWMIASMISDAQKESTHCHGIAAENDPGYWRIPSRCQRWGMQQYATACNWMDLIRLQRGITLTDTV